MAHAAPLRAAVLLAACLANVGCRDGEGDRDPSARGFPRADRPVSPILSTRWSDERTRDRQNEANVIMDRAGIRPGMTVADIGAGEGYYTVRLAARVGPKGRVLAEDIMPEVIDALGRRITRENWANVSVKLGTPVDPKLPAASFDRVFLVHMYHEVTEPYAFLWYLHPALKPDGQVIVVDADRATEQHGTPPKLLACEFAASGFRLIAREAAPLAGGFIARFAPMPGRPRPDEMRACKQGSAAS